MAKPFRNLLEKMSLERQARARAQTRRFRERYGGLSGPDLLATLPPAKCQCGSLGAWRYVPVNREGWTIELMCHHGHNRILVAQPIHGATVWPEPRWATQLGITADQRARVGG